MKVLYNLGILFLRIGAAIASLFNSKARAFVEGRVNTFQVLQNAALAGQGKVIWVHCASLGEFEQGRPMMESVRNEFPLHKIVLTFFSPSGYEVRKNYNGADIVCYLPHDTSANATRFIEIVNPALAVFVKYEFWYHYFSKLHAQRIPILSVSAIFRSNQIFFKSYGGFYQNILKCVSHFFVQNEKSEALLNSIGITQVSIAGDTRFDRVSQIVADASPLAIAQQFKGDSKAFVVGSSWPEDFEVLKDFINEENLKFIIAPHEISESSLKLIENGLKVKTIRYSQAKEHEVQNYKVLLIDNIGMLSRLYRYGEYAYVGGAFGKGLHNILEAACYGIPVFFGNKRYQKFQEAMELIVRGGAFVVNDPADMADKFARLASGDSYRRASQETKSYVAENLGATEKIMAYCRPLLS